MTEIVSTHRDLRVTAEGGAPQPAAHLDHENAMPNETTQPAGHEIQVMDGRIGSRSDDRADDERRQLREEHALSPFIRDDDDPDEVAVDAEHFATQIPSGHEVVLTANFGSSGDGTNQMQPRGNAAGGGAYADVIAAALEGKFVFDAHEALASMLAVEASAGNADIPDAGMPPRSNPESAPPRAERPWSSSTPTALSGLGAPGQLRSLSSAMGAGHGKAADARTKEMLHRLIHGAPSHARDLAQAAAAEQTDGGIAAANFTTTLRNGRPLGAPAERPAWPRPMHLGIPGTAGKEDRQLLQRAAARQLYRLQAKHHRHEVESKKVLEGAHQAAGAQREAVLTRALTRLTDQLEQGDALLAAITEQVLAKEDERRKNKLRAWHNVWTERVYNRVQDEVKQATETTRRSRGSTSPIRLPTTKKQLDDVDPSRLPLTRTQREFAAVGGTKAAQALQSMGAKLHPDGRYEISAPLGLTSIPIPMHKVERGLRTDLPPGSNPRPVGTGALLGPFTAPSHSGAPATAGGTATASTNHGALAFTGLDDVSSSYASTAPTVSSAASGIPESARQRSFIASVANAALNGQRELVRGVSFPSSAASLIPVSGTIPDTAAETPTHMGEPSKADVRRLHAGSTPFTSSRVPAPARESSPNRSGVPNIVRSPSAQALAALTDSMRRVSIVTASSAFFDGAGATNSPRADAARVVAPAAISAGGATSSTALSHSISATSMMPSPLRVPSAAPPVARCGITTYRVDALGASDKRRHHPIATGNQALLTADDGSRAVLHPAVWISGKIEDTTFVREWPLVGDGLIRPDHPAARSFAESGQRVADTERTKILGSHADTSLPPEELAEIMRHEAAGYGPGYRGKKRVPAPKPSPDLDSVVRKRGHANTTLEARLEAGAAEMRDIMRAAIVPQPRAHPSLRRVHNAALETDHVQEAFESLAKFQAEVDAAARTTQPRPRKW